MPRLLYLIIVSFALTCPGSLCAQDQADPALYEARLKLMVDTYMRAASKTLPINGREYLRYPFPIAEGTPYFDGDSPAPGSVIYDGIRYDSVMIMYDVAADEPITYTHNKQNLVRLHKRLVSEFMIGQKKFVSLDTVSGVSPGYYEVVCESRDVRIVKRNRKEIKDVIQPGEGLKWVVRSGSDHFLHVDGKYLRTNSLNALIASLDDGQESLKAYLHKNKRRLKRANSDDAFCDVVHHYAELAKK